MHISKEYSLIFWFNTPPKVSKGAFNYVTKVWPGDVFYVINQDFAAERKLTNWDDGDFGNAKVIMLNHCTDEQQTIAKLFQEHSNAIHIVSGFNNSITLKIKPYLFKPKIKAIAFSERPVTMGGVIELVARKIYFQFKYRKLHKQFNPFISAFLPLGQKGVDTFANYGWSKNKMYPFMYNPVINRDYNKLASKTSGCIKFLYIGRFYYKTKGIDTLMKATEKLTGNWSLDLVGGYGANKEDVIAWTKKQRNVKFIGQWDSMEVSNNMTWYDIVVVPSKYDGWNLITNEAIYAGIATITTDEAVSHELIQKSSSGIIVPANNPQRMAESMQYAINNPSVINQWKERATEYSRTIMPESVGQYFIDIIIYTFFNEGTLSRPKCPWL